MRVTVRVVFSEPKSSNLWVCAGINIDCATVQLVHM